MRCAIVSDLHANLQAWNAALLDMRTIGVDQIVCLGDIVGYGPNPAEVLESVHANVDYLVMGNHDAAVCGKIDPALFTEAAETMIHWTREHLNTKALKFLSDLPLSLSSEFFRCAHGDLQNPGAFNYIFEPEDALLNWDAAPDTLMFVGHTHHPAIFVLGESGIPRSVEPQDFILEPGKRFLVNVGSIGQPRNQTIKATYCIFDTTTSSVYWRSIPFDLDAYVQAVKQAGVPVDANFFLEYDPRRAAVPLREIVSFSPPQTAEQQVQDAVEVKEMRMLERRMARWRGAAAASVLVTILLAGGGLSAWWAMNHRTMEISGQAVPPLIASTFATDSNILPSLDTLHAPEKPLAGWTKWLGNRKCQSLAGIREDNAILLRMTSDAPDAELRMTSAPISVSSGAKYTVEASFRQNTNTTGSAAVVISLSRLREDTMETIDRFLVKEPLMARKDGWMTARQTFTLPAGSSEIAVSIRANFQGSIDVRDFRLERKE